MPGTHPQSWIFDLDVVKSIRYQPDGFSVLILFSSKKNYKIMSFMKLESKHESRLIELIREQKVNLYDNAMYVIYRPNVKLFGLFGPTSFKAYETPEYDLIKHCVLQSGYEFEDSVVVAKDGFSSVRFGNMKS